MKPIQKRLHLVVLRLGVLGVFVLAAQASAQIGFEPPDYNGSADGTSIAGQQGWYTPPVPGAIAGLVYTYEGNALGFSPDPDGETQFLGGTGVALGDFVRAQLDFDFAAADVWTASWDLAVNFLGTLPASNNVSSFSTQDSTSSRTFTAVNPWMDPDTANSWMAGFITYNADGTTIDPGGFPVAPGPEFTNLQLDHWYRESITFDFSNNTVVSVTHRPGLWRHHDLLAQRLVSARGSVHLRAAADSGALLRRRRGHGAGQCGCIRQSGAGGVRRRGPRSRKASGSPVHQGQGRVDQQLVPRHRGFDRLRGVGAESHRWRR
jgi:hypothetical protein